MRNQNRDQSWISWLVVAGIVFLVAALTVVL